VLPSQLRRAVRSPAVPHPLHGRICAFRMKDDQLQVSHWRPLMRVAFRFSFAYFGLYALVSHLFVYLFVLPNTLPGQGPGTLWPLFDVPSWIAVHLFGIRTPLVYTGNSRDTNFFWVQLFLVLVAALIATIVWSLLDRRRGNYISLHKWFRLVMRFALAAQMI